MEAHEERMLKEGEDLSGNVQRLAAFVTQSPLYHELPELDQTLLQAQLSAMTTYLNILSLRIARINRK